MNYLTPLTSIAQRLRDVLPASLEVRVALDIAEVQDQAFGGAPEVWVLFHSDQTLETADDYTRLDFVAMVIYVTPGNLQDMSRDGEALTSLTKALSGYDAGLDEMQPFKRVGSMRPQNWAKAGLVAYGMLFATQLML